MHRERVKDVILQRIVSGEYPPGSRLVETRIAQELGVSQAPVREALRDLEQLGCIVHEPFRGCSVRAFSADELLEAFPVRAALEALAARLAAERISEQELLRLAELLETMRAAARRGDAHGQSQANASFHATIVRAARNVDARAPVGAAGAVLAHLPHGVAARASTCSRCPSATSRSSTRCAPATPTPRPTRCTEHLMDAAELLKEPV